jgi:hypothetical protein
MKKFFKVFISSALSLLMVFTLSITIVSHAKADTNDSGTIIEKMVTAIQDKDWDTFTYLMSSDQQKYYVKYFEDSSYNNGVKQVQTVSLESITNVQDDLAKSDLLSTEYPVLNNLSIVETYIVGLNCTVSKENQYFYNGLNYFLIALANENGEMKIVQFNRPTYNLANKTIEQQIDSTDTNYQDEMGALNVIKNASHGYLINGKGEAITDGFTIIQKENSQLNNGTIQPEAYSDTPNLGLYTSYSAPDVIEVLMNRDEDDNAVVEFPFDYYIKNTINNEWINGWNTQSLKAGAFCIKAAGWYRIISPVNSSIGYDVTQYTQYFSVDTSRSNTDAIFDSIDGLFMVNSTNHVFYGEYGAGSPGSAGTSGTGRLLQYGSQYLASSKSYTYSQILDYYYKGSAYSSGNIKFVSVY